jgi:hypothetical protein
MAESIKARAEYLPVTADDANRQQTSARLFYLLGDFMKGVDTLPRMEPGMADGSPLLGPATNTTDIGLGNGGEVFVRGQAGQVGTVVSQPPAAKGPLGLSRPVLLMGAAALLLGLYLLRKR